MRNESHMMQAPWWLEAGPETCPFCEARHHYEVRLHCIECDSPLCPLCTVEVTATRDIFCPECHQGVP